MLLARTMDKIEQGIQSWLETTVSYPVVFSGQNMVRPPAPFVSWKLLTGMIKIGSFDELYVNKNDLNYHLKGQRQFTALFEATGIATDGTLKNRVRATDILGEIQYSLNKPETIGHFQNINLVIQEENEISDITELLETEYEPRASLEITFRIAIDEIVDPGTIDLISVSGDLDTNFDGNYNLPIEEFTIAKP